MQHHGYFSILQVTRVQQSIAPWFTYHQNTNQSNYNIQRLMMTFLLPLMSQILQRASPRYIGFPAQKEMCKLANTARQHILVGYFSNRQQ